MAWSNPSAAVPPVIIVPTPEVATPAFCQLPQIDFAASAADSTDEVLEVTGLVIKRYFLLPAIYRSTVTSPLIGTGDADVTPPTLAVITLFDFKVSRLLVFKAPFFTFRILVKLKAELRLTSAVLLMMRLYNSLLNIAPASTCANEPFISTVPLSP